MKSMGRTLHTDIPKSAIHDKQNMTSGDKINSHSPIKLPLYRRFTTLSILLHCSSIILLPCLYFYLWTFESLWPVLIVYSVYTYILDDTPTTGASIYRTSTFWRTLSIYKGFIDYFPIITHRTVPLPPTLEEKTVKKFCLPSWTRALPNTVIRFLKYSGLISEKERTVISEEAIGPRYIFACHPHGVISLGITGLLCWGGKSQITKTKITEGVNFSLKDFEIDNPKDVEDDSQTTHHILLSSKSFASLFPGIKTHLLTISTQFLLPFYRDYIMALGVGLVTKSGIASLLKKNRSVAIVIGGAHESLLAKQGSNKIVLNKRKGFIKIALQNCNRSDTVSNLTEEQIDQKVMDGKWNCEMSNIAIVPTYIYGENNIHNVFNTTEYTQQTSGQQNEKSKLLNLLLKMQLRLKNLTGFTIPIVNSRSIFNYDFGLLPYRRKVDIVVGKPIYITRKFGSNVGDEVTQEEIDYFHSLYIEQLMRLWKDNRMFCSPTDEELSIVY